jgi:hypothetical protein
MACVRWSSGSRTTRAPPPSNTNWQAGMTFGSALYFSRFPPERTGVLREAPWVKLAKGSAKHGLLERPADGAIRDPTVNARTANGSRNQRLAFVACSPGAGRAMTKLPMIAERNTRLPPVARQGQSCPLTVYAGVVGQGPFVWQDSNAPWRNPARPSDNRAGGPISRGIRPVTNCIESADAASTT